MRESAMRKYIAKIEAIYPWRFSSIQRQHKKCLAAIDVLMELCEQVRVADPEGKPKKARDKWVKVNTLARSCLKQVLRKNLSDRVSKDLDRMIDRINRRLHEVDFHGEEPASVDRFLVLTGLGSVLFMSAANGCPYFSRRDNGDMIKAWDELYGICADVRDALVVEYPEEVFDTVLAINEECLKNHIGCDR